MDTLFSRASAIWRGNVGRGSGTLTSGSGAMKELAYGNINHRDGQQTSPHELMAAAQAGCFSLALASELAEAGFTPEHIETVATIRLAEPKHGWAVIEIFLDTTVVVARLSQTQFVDAALSAKNRCSMAQLDKARVWMQARLKPPQRPPATSRSVDKRRAAKPTRLRPISRSTRDSQ